MEGPWILRYVIYYRESLFHEDEYEAAKEAGFTMVNLLTDLQKDDFVIPRYTTLPFAEDVYAEFANIGCKVINPYADHKIMADLFIWAKLLGNLTPKTYNQYEMARLPEGAYVLKGATNSKKSYWNTHMFAPTKKDVSRVFANLVDDSLIGNQEIAIREYVPLVTVGEGINGLPITKEYRLFCLGDRVISSGYYWQNYVDDVNVNSVAIDPEDKVYAHTVKLATDCLSQFVNFYCIDLAQTQTGDWIVIEVNDATMSGLSCIDPKTFYRNLYEEVRYHADKGSINFLH